MKYPATIIAKCEPELLEDLRQVAEEEDRSVSAVVRRLLVASLATRRALGEHREGRAA